MTRKIKAVLAYQQASFLVIIVSDPHVSALH